MKDGESFAFFATHARTWCAVRHITTSRTSADSVSAPREPSSDGSSIFFTAMSAPVRASRSATKVASGIAARTADAEASFAAFLQRTADAHLVEVAAAELGFVDSDGVVDGALRLWPWHVAGDVGGCDAHYAARARKGRRGSTWG